ncbi:MAG: SDR family oxidoreductase, partial [Haliea sp.]|nr:SDR family oxidoreductase [Haliea sp.]
LADVVASEGNIDILVNNAGINGADGINLEDCDDDLSKKLFEVNTFGVYYGLKYGPQYMNDGGSIINTASLAASYVFPGSGPYSASKAAVANLTTMSASELAKRRIRVNAVAPSFIRTPLAMDDIELFEKIGERATNALRIAEPEEVAAVFHFLASDDAGYINGQVINVDGGMSIGLTEAMVELIAR